MSSNSNNQPDRQMIPKWTVPLLLMLSCGGIVYAILENRSRQKEDTRETREVISKLMQVLRSSAELNEKNAAEITTLKNRLAEIEIEVRAQKTAAVASVSTKPEMASSDIRKLSDNLEDFKGTVTANFNALATVCNEHTKLLATLAKRTNTPSNSPATEAK